MRELSIVYDGECPLCRNCTSLLQFTENADQATLVDARHAADVRRQLMDLGFDLDLGMVVKTEDRTYHGADAVTFLAHVVDDKGFFNRLFFYLFRSGPVTQFYYPFLRATRNLMLWVKNVPQFGALDKGDLNER